MRSPFDQSTNIFLSESSYLKSNQLRFSVVIIFTGPQPYLVRMTHIDFLTRHNSGLTNLQLNPKPVVSYKPEKPADLRHIMCLPFYLMLQKSMRTLPPLLFLISSSNMSALCYMLCNISNFSLWIESSKIVQINNGARWHHNVLTCNAQILQYLWIMSWFQKSYYIAYQNQQAHTVFFHTAFLQVCYYKPNTNCLRIS